VAPLLQQSNSTFVIFILNIEVCYIYKEEVFGQGKTTVWRKSMSWELRKQRFLYIWFVAIIGVGLLTIISIAYPTNAADGDMCYLVSGAGMEGVNGTYKSTEANNGRPVYKHEELDYYISYEAHGWGNEWDLTTAIEGGLDLYWASSSATSPPSGLWNTGNDGADPRAMVTRFDCSEGQIETFAFDLIGGESLDGSNGTVGAFTPSSCYYGTLYISKMSPPFYDKSFFHIYGNTLDIKIVDQDGKELESYCGLYYVYFNLNAETLKLWQAGKLSVYQYGNKAWIKLWPYLVDAGDHGRLAIVITAPGIFALAAEK
jgi:hypothetical protein